MFIHPIEFAIWSTVIDSVPMEIVRSGFLKYVSESSMKQSQIIPRSHLWRPVHLSYLMRG